LVQFGVQYLSHFEFQVAVNFYGRWGRINTIRDVAEGRWLDLQYMEDRIDSVEMVREFD